MAGDEGCYADGAHGDRHRQEVLADLLGSIRGNKEADELSDELQKLSAEEDEEEREFAYEVENDAIGVLNQHTDESLCWEMYEGNLYLVKREDVED